MKSDSPNLKEEIGRRMAASKKNGAAWTPADFVDLASRDAVDKTLQRLTNAGELRRIDRGIYDRPLINKVTKQATAPDPRELIQALSRRGQSRMLIDGHTAARDLGLVEDSPERIVIHTEARIRPIQLGALSVEFRPTAPSKLYWAGRPAMRVVQSLHYLKSRMAEDHPDRAELSKKFLAILTDKKTGVALREDLRSSMSSIPIWMQRIIRPLLEEAEAPPKVEPAAPAVPEQIDLPF